MVDVKIEETHRRTIAAKIGSKELARLIAQSVAAGSAIDLDSASTSYKVTYEDETEGSPAYRVGTKARVEIVVDLAGEEAARRDVSRVRLPEPQPDDWGGEKSGGDTPLFAAGALMIAAVALVLLSNPLTL
jgi:hypothetical protein